MILNKYWTFINWDKVSNARPGMSTEDKMAELNYRVGQLPNARQAAINAATYHTTVKDEADMLDATGKLWKLMRNEPVARAIEPACSEKSPWMRHDKQVRFGGPVLSRGV